MSKYNRVVTDSFSDVKSIIGAAAKQVSQIAMNVKDQVKDQIECKKFILNHINNFETKYGVKVVGYDLNHDVNDDGQVVTTYVDSIEYVYLNAPEFDGFVFITDGSEKVDAIVYLETYTPDDIHIHVTDNVTITKQYGLVQLDAIIEVTEPLLIGDKETIGKYIANNFDFESIWEEVN